ncbi:DUF6182 family protein [Streptomyces sp. NBC_01142]|uniref:DUF6182 family protein n=1 Tax=Streptomyces sp. NBC_01142 TaxID=2975865 RepID=UPI002253482C|nr:DUF6182 family protein [Streptomyces sp. NBC_01142]MCX4824951.1 DUF6182 family protein [Streptomyces sp. NBC_01142]
MTPAQTELCAAAARRIASVRPDLAGRHDLTSLPGLMAARADIAAQGDDGGVTATVVVRHLDLAEWIRASCAFAFGLDASTAAAWRRSFTRTVFLAGNPAHLRERFSFAHVAEDLSVAWTAPAPAAQSASLGRLLKLFDGPAALPARADSLIELPASRGVRSRPSVHRELFVAVAGCTVSDALVHLNHVLAEAVLDGLIAPGDRLTLRQVPRLVGVPARLVSLRVVTESPGRLKAAAGLSEEALLV